MASDSLRFLGDDSSPVNWTCDIRDKDTAVYRYIQYMLDRTNRMFKYENLPDTIPDYLFEYMLQTYGSVAIVEVNSSIYALRCNFGGPPDPYYRPTQAVVANPALNLSYTYRIMNNFPPFDIDTWSKYAPCIRVINDTQIQGLIPLFARYAVQMAENDVSIRSAQINTRQQTVIVADSGPEAESARLYIKGLEDGKLEAIVKRPFKEGITVSNTSQGRGNTVMQLIELQQYLKASWYNEIGLNSNFNMKSQYISSEEINSSADIMLPLIDNMFECRKRGVNDINKQFGTDIIVQKDSAWEMKQLQADMGVGMESDNDSHLQDSSVDLTGYSLSSPEDVDDPHNVDSEDTADQPNADSDNQQDSDSIPSHENSIEIPIIPDVPMDVIIAIDDSTGEEESADGMSDADTEPTD